MALKVGILLSGCGVFDGSEIQEAVFTLLAVDQAGAEAVFLAPDCKQAEVIDHKAGKASETESRNVLTEAARIARGQIVDVSKAQGNDLDALFLPGGFGAAKNLCNFAVAGADCEVHPEVARLIREVHEAGKPLGFVCIAPAVAAKVLGNGVQLTIGNDGATAAALEQMGAKHIEKPVDEICYDEEKKVVSAPAYMYGDARPSKIAEGIAKAVKKVIELAGG